MGLKLWRWHVGRPEVLAKAREGKSVVEYEAASVGGKWNVMWGSEHVQGDTLWDIYGGK